jgi:hypothetical protein
MSSLPALSLALLICACGRVPLDLAASDGAGGATGAAGVSGAAGVVGAAGAGGRAPAQHKPPNGAACPVTSRQSAPCQGGGSCSVDADCSAGQNGRCTPTGASQRCGCVYDDCGSDADCGGALCACDPFDIGNVCVGGSCHVDTDCGPLGFCSPVIAPCNGQIVGYQCHSTRDTCLLDADCASGKICASFELGEPWTCQGPIICG